MEPHAAARRARLRWWSFEFNFRTNFLIGWMCWRGGILMWAD